MPTIADRLKILVDWWPLVVLLQQVAVSAPGRAQAEAFDGWRAGKPAAV